jgi:hypothetical protein
MKNKTQKTFTFEGLGFPIKLINVPISAKDKEFRALYKELSLEKLSKPARSAKIHPITVDASADDLKIAL